ncbi:MAG TPA: hypothetical protein VFZ73_18895 [Gemmatimonadaceae bacterium]
MARHGTSETSRGVAAVATPDALSSLLETERQLSEDIANAAEKARVLAEAARGAVAHMESAFDAELAESMGALERSEEAVTQAAIAAEAHAATEEVRRLTAVPDEFVTRLAEAVLQDFLGIATIGTPKPRAHAHGDAGSAGERHP